MFNNKRIAKLEHRVKDLEDMVRRMYEYLQTASEPRIIEFIPDPELTDEMKRKMN